MSGRAAIPIVLALGLLVRVAACAAIPHEDRPDRPDRAPDERWHFAVVRDAPRGFFSGRPAGAPVYVVFPPAQYLAQAATFHAARLAGASGIWFARLGSVLLGLLTIWALSRAAAEWGGDPLVAGLVVALHPQLVFLNSYVNADSFTVAAGGLLVWAISRWVRPGESGEGLPAVAAALGLVAAGKANGWFVFLPTLAWAGWASLRKRVSSGDLLRAAAAFACVCGPLLIWNALRMDGDALGLRHFQDFMQHEWRGSAGREVPGAVRRFVNSLTTSSVGNFRNLDLPLPGPLILGGWALMSIGAAAALRAGLRAGGPALRGTAWAAACLALNFALVAWSSWFVDFQPQGRYLLLNLLLLCIAAALLPFAGPMRARWRVANLGFWAVCCASMLVLLVRTR